MDMHEVGRLVDLAIRAVREERLRVAIEHVGYGQDVGDDGIETLAEATIDHEGVTHIRTVRLDDRNAEDGVDSR